MRSWVTTLEPLVPHALDGFVVLVQELKSEVARGLRGRSRGGQRFAPGRKAAVAATVPMADQYGIDYRKPPLSPQKAWIVWTGWGRVWAAFLDHPSQTIDYRIDLEGVLPDDVTSIRLHRGESSLYIGRSRFMIRRSLRWQK